MMAMNVLVITLSKVTNKILRHAKEHPEVQEEQSFEQLDGSQVSENVLQLITLDH